MQIGVLRTLSELLSRASFAGRAGKTFKGSRDLYEALGYPRILHPADFRERYDRGGVAARVVEAAPKATWRAGIELIEDEDPEVLTEFEDVWNELAQRLQVWSVFARADVLAGLGRFAVILMGMPGMFDTPSPNRLAPEDIVYLTPLSEQHVTVDSWVEDPEDERFGLPMTYQVRFISPNNTVGRGDRSVNKKIHWTRVLPVADGMLDDRFYGQARLERVWNDLDNLDKVVGGGSEAFWQRVHQGMHFDLDKDLVIENEAEEKALKEAVEEFAHGFRRTIATRGMKLDVLGSDVANFANQLDGILTLISGATGIPKRILMGSERGELASTQDKDNWDEKISDRRREFAEPQVVRPFVKMLMDKGALPEPKDGYQVRWPEIAKLSDTERADVAVKWAGLNTASGDIVVTAAEIRDRVLQLDPLTDEQLAEEEEKKAAKLQEQQEIMRGEAAIANGEDPPERDQPQGFPRAAAGKALPRGNRGSSESTGSLHAIRGGLPKS
jgi:hypothetical protein